MGKINNDNFGNRLKENYEHCYRFFLPKRLPVILRVDGKSFHSFTKGFQKPLDPLMAFAMKKAVLSACQQIEGCRLAYSQSDEASFLLTQRGIKEEPFFNNNMQKIVSVTASIITVAFNRFFAEAVDTIETFSNASLKDIYSKKINAAVFDARAFVIPEKEVTNYFLWRQYDCTRNAIESLGRAYFSHKQLYKIKGNQIQEKLFQEKGINFNNMPLWYRRGWCAVKIPTILENGTIRNKWEIDENIPKFLDEGRDYIEKLLLDSPDKEGIV